MVRLAGAEPLDRRRLIPLRDGASDRPQDAPGEQVDRHPVGGPGLVADPGVRRAQVVVRIRVALGGGALASVGGVVLGPLVAAGAAAAVRRRGRDHAAAEDHLLLRVRRLDDKAVDDPVDVLGPTGRATKAETRYRRRPVCSPGPVDQGVTTILPMKSPSIIAAKPSLTSSRPITRSMWGRSLLAWTKRSIDSISLRVAAVEPITRSCW